MATSITVADSVNYPDNPKTVTVDLKSIVDALSEGDERWFLSAVTSATAAGSTSIDDELVSYTLNGYSRSSGLPSSPFVVTSGSNYLRVSIDGSTSREIEVTLGSYTGSALADEIETQIKALASSGQPEAGNLSFKNAACDFVNNKLELKSGTISNTYTGTGRSSVEVIDGLTGTGLAALTGYDIPFESRALALKADSIVVTKLTAGVSSGSTLAIANGVGISNGDAILVKGADGTEQRFIVTAGGGTSSLTVTPTVSETFLTGEKVQTLVEADPESVPSSPTADVDSILRKSIASIVSQIDFSS